MNDGNETRDVYTRFSIILLQKFHDASIPYPTMHHFVTEICTCVHISVTTEMCTFLLQNGTVWVICVMHYGVCEMGLFFLCTVKQDSSYNHTNQDINDMSASFNNFCLTIMTHDMDSTLICLFSPRVTAVRVGWESNQSSTQFSGFRSAAWAPFY